MTCDHSLPPSLSLSHRKTRLVARQTERQSVSQTDRQTNSQTERLTVRQTDRQP